jgi:thiamine pyrophosphate-dependent acetolactate synthase large subunit-like protein
VDRLPRLLANAFKTMLSGRMGPVNIDVPYDLFVEKPTSRFRTTAMEPLDQFTTLGNPDAVRKAFDLLRNAEKPLILAGGGVISPGLGGSESVG